MIVFDAEAHVSKDLSKEGPNDNLRTVIGNNHDSPFCIAKNIMAALSSGPMKACCLSYLTQLSIGDQAELRHAGTSTLQVPTKSDRGSSGEVVFR